MKESLQKFFEKYMEMWKAYYGTFPSTSYDEDIDPRLYVGEVDEDEYIFWQPLVKDCKTEFLAVETQYNIIVNEDIKEYFNCYWFLELKGFFEGDSIVLEPVIPGVELENFCTQLEGYNMTHNGLDFIPIGVNINNNDLIIVENSTRKVYFEDLDSGQKKYVAENLEEFIENIHFSNK